MKTRKSAMTNIRKSEEVYIKNLSKNKNVYKDLIEFHKKKILPNFIENNDDYVKLYENIYSHLREERFELYLNLSNKLEPEQLQLPASRVEEYFNFISSLAEIVRKLFNIFFFYKNEFFQDKSHRLNQLKQILEITLTSLKDSSLTLKNRIDESKNSFMVSISTKEVYNHRILDVQNTEIICVDSKNSVNFQLRYSDGIDFMHKGTEIFLTGKDKRFFVKFKNLEDLKDFAEFVVPIMNFN